jgi:hypothetical protein
MKVLREILKLKRWFNPDTSIFVEKKDSGRDLVVDNAGIAFNLLDLSVEPKIFMKHLLILILST